MTFKKQTSEKKKYKSVEKKTSDEPVFDVWTFVNSIMHNKKYLFNEETASVYDPFTINKALSFHRDLIYYANEINSYYNLPKKLQYDYLINSIRPQKRYAKWEKYDVKSESHKNILAIQEYYGYNFKKALAVSSILSEEQLAIIKQKLEKGGIVNEPN